MNSMATIYQNTFQLVLRSTVLSWFLIMIIFKTFLQLTWKCKQTYFLIQKIYHHQNCLFGACGLWLCGCSSWPGVISSVYDCHAHCCRSFHWCSQKHCCFPIPVVNMIFAVLVNKCCFWCQFWKIQTSYMWLNLLFMVQLLFVYHGKKCKTLLAICHCWFIGVPISVKTD